MFTSKTKGFTIQEVLIVMLLTTVVMISAFYLLRIVNGAFSHQSQQYTDAEERLFLWNMIGMDLERGMVIELDSTTLVLAIDSIACRYLVKDSIVIRENLSSIRSVDTFRVGASFFDRREELLRLVRQGEPGLSWSITDSDDALFLEFDSVLIWE